METTKETTTTVLLNKEQQEAAEYLIGSLLILAPAGSGKTKVLSVRYANLLKSGVHPNNILAITFTNKSAQALRERIALATGIADRFSFIGTFHGMCNKLLRRSISVLGRQGPDFSICVSHEQEKLCSHILKELKAPKEIKVGTLVDYISKAKTAMKLPSELTAVTATQITLLAAYTKYENLLYLGNSLDFDDLILYMIRVFEKSPETLEYYQDQFKFLQIDEVQDTNPSQFKVISLLAAKNRNICVIGDDSQSIYKFRGADYRNILDFQKYYPEAKIVILTKNYRSVPEVITASNNVIRYNIDRFDKVAESVRPSKGEAVKVIYAESNYDEAEQLATIIKTLVDKGTYTFRDFAVLYRTRSMSTVLENVFLRHRIPTQVVSGLNFQDRKEIRDMMAYLKLICNPHDNMSFGRIINTPKRGIGSTSVAKMITLANEENSSIYKFIHDNPDITAKRLGVNTGTFNALLDFFQKLDQLRELRNLPVEALIDGIVSIMGYEEELEKRNKGKIIIDDGTEEDYTVYIEQLKEIASQMEEAGDSKSPLENFLTCSALASDTDNLEEAHNKVKLLTVHSSKGLEWPVVMIVSLCQGIFPHKRSLSSEDLPEERRLFYVGCSRSMDLLYLCVPETMHLYGSIESMQPSQFLSEIY